MLIRLSVNQLFWGNGVGMVKNWGNLSCLQLVNSSPPGQNGHNFTDDGFKEFSEMKSCFFYTCILIWMSLKFVLKGPINNIPTLVQLMAWHWLGDKLLSEHMMVRLQMHIYIYALGLIELSRKASVMRWVCDDQSAWFKIANYKL